MNEQPAGGAIQSVRRAIDVLFCFDRDTRTLTVAEIASTLGLNRTTTWRYLQSLAETGLVRELGEPGRYALGPRSVQLAEAYASQWGDLVALSNVVLVELRDATDETSALHVRQGWSRIVVSQMESRQELHRVYRDIGEPISLLAGAPSMAILAWLSDDEREAYLDTQASDDPRRKRTLENEIAQIRTAGYAVSRQSRTTNVASVAAPIIIDGIVVASVNVTGPMERFEDAAVGAFAEHVRRAAEQIEHRLVGAQAQRPAASASSGSRGDHASTGPRST